MLLLVCVFRAARVCALWDEQRPPVEERRCRRSPVQHLQPPPETRQTTAEPEEERRETHKHTPVPLSHRCRDEGAEGHSVGVAAVSIQANC